ncbi:MAG: hypothetical protein LBD32_02200 [Cytophagales bacterium]|jgi:(p)ppGpp synthase/HD superfamily hydrolase|nr:hypothetical protein [Cytophagales bacterium]
MTDFVKRIVQNFYNLRRYNKAYAFALLCDIKKFVIPIFRCKLWVENTIKVEDEYLRYVDPINYYKFSIFRYDYDRDKDFLKSVVDSINKIFQKSGFEFQYCYRVKSVYSIVNLVKNKFVYDKFGINILFNIGPENSYQFAWWIVENLHNNFKILKIKDFLSCPRKTGYSALHVIILVESISIEVQIISYDDVRIKIPHFEYKQFMSQNNLYIEKDSKTAENKIIQDLINYSKCRLLKE